MVDTTAPRDAGDPRDLVYIVRSYPRLSQTFILNEILALERMGLKIEIFAVANPREPIVQDGVADVRAPTHYLDELARRPLPARMADHLAALTRAPLRYLLTAADVIRRRDLDRGYRTLSRLAAFGAAVRVARALTSHRRGRGAEHPRVHSHFAHDPTLIALLLKRLTGIPFSFTAHARDLYQLEPAHLVERVRAASTVVTCCRANLAYLKQLVPSAEWPKIHVVHHGLDREALTVRPGQRPATDAEAGAPLIVSVGRLVEKKGFHDLIRALALVRDRARPFRCVIYGDGPMRGELEEAVAAASLGGRVVIAGVRRQREILAALRTADLFVLTPFVTGDGDRDGIPNTILEAMAAGLPVVSTAVAGIPEAVIHGETGLLAPAGDVNAIADDLDALLSDSGLRTRLGARGRQLVEEEFVTDRSAARLVELLTPR